MTPVLDSRGAQIARFRAAVRDHPGTREDDG